MGITHLDSLTLGGDLVVTGTTTIAATTQTDLTTTGNTTLGNAVTDTTAINGATTITTTSASGLTVGRAGATNPVLKVNAATASVATGLQVTGAAAASGLAVDVVSSGANENLTIDAKGSGTITLAGTSTGAVTITPATTITGALTNTGATYANGGVDRSTAAALAIGATNATSVVITPATTVTGALTTSAGIANTGTISTTALTATAGITSSGATGAGIGYATGAGGTVTQITSRTTGVTLSKLSGTIQTDTSSLVAEASADFIVTNTTVAIGDVVVVAIRSGSNGGNTAVSVTTVTNGTFTIKVSNNNAAGGTAETGAIIINFAVIKAVSA